MRAVPIYNESFLFNSWSFARASQRIHICENDNLNKAEIKMYGRTGRISRTVVLLTACFDLGVIEKVCRFDASYSTHTDDHL